MERDEMNKKDGVGRGPEDYKAKGPWDYRPRFFGGGDNISNGVAGGFSWPPRSYTCSFCKREFRSAQALGGHMNVHRRDRARLRQSPPWVDQSSNPNPNPDPDPDDHNPNSSTSNPTKLPPFTCVFPSLNSSSSSSSSHACFAPPSSSPSPSTNQARIYELAASSADPSPSKEDGLRRKQALKELFNAGTLKDYVVDRDRDDILSGRDVVSLDLEIGLRRDLKDGLDLELRLGYA